MWICRMPTTFFFFFFLNIIQPVIQVLCIIYYNKQKMKKLIITGRVLRSASWPWCCGDAWWRLCEEIHQRAEPASPMEKKKDPIILSINMLHVIELWLDSCWSYLFFIMIIFFFEVNVRGGAAQDEKNSSFKKQAMNLHFFYTHPARPAAKP